MTLAEELDEAADWAQECGKHRFAGALRDRAARVRQAEEIAEGDAGLSGPLRRSITASLAGPTP